MGVQLYTWDFVVLRHLLEGPRPSNKDDKADHPHLVALGFMEPKLEVVKPKYAWDKPVEKTFFHITDAGLAWLKKVTDRWEAETEGTAWWTVATSHGGVIIGIPDFLHPDEVEADLRTLLGSNFRFLPPRHDESAGAPRKLKTTCAHTAPKVTKEVPWRPWLDASQAWIDCRSESGAFFRGAYMRLHGAPFDPMLAFAEAVGCFPGSCDVREDEAQRLCLLDTMEETT